MTHSNVQLQSSNISTMGALAFPETLSSNNSQPVSPADFSTNRETSLKSPISCNREIALQSQIASNSEIELQSPTSSNQEISFYGPGPPHYNTPSLSSKTRKRKKTDGNLDFDNTIMESVKMDLEKSKQGEEGKDPDRLFCLSLVQEFKDSKTAKKKRKARLGILKLFCDLHDTDEEDI